MDLLFAVVGFFFGIFPFEGSSSGIPAGVDAFFLACSTVTVGMVPVSIDGAAKEGGALISTARVAGVTSLASRLVVIDSLPSAFETVKLSVRLGCGVDPVPGSPSATGADDDDDEDELSISGVDTSERRKNCQGQKNACGVCPMKSGSLVIERRKRGSLVIERSVRCDNERTQLSEPKNVKKRLDDARKCIVRSAMA